MTFIFTQTDTSFSPSFDGNASFPLDMEEHIGGEVYTGEYGFTPSAEEQRIEISGKIAAQDITIAPIPNNYGLITWDGSTLTVS